MSAEPSPPGPPDDRLGHLENRVGELEQWREHELPYSIASVNFGLSVLQREMRDVAAGVTRQGQRQDQIAAAVTDLTAAQREQLAILEAQGRILNGHTAALSGHTQALADLGSAVQEILRRLPPVPEG